MDSTNRNLSLLFYRYLCNVIGSEEVVKRRRQIFNALDYVRNDDSFSFISSGSKAEGLDLKGSDYDEMWVVHVFRVHENIDTIDMNTRIALLMDTDNTKPGFTLLKLYNKDRYHYNSELRDLCEIVDGEIFFSSQHYKVKHQTEGLIIHGPCQSTPNETVDFARTLHCKEWIGQANEWIYRSRTSWPSNCLIDTIRQSGVLFVPIGSKGSPNEDIEWRISFSVAEKILIHSFSHTQLLCYALLKILLKDIIKKKHGDLICSYFLKTIMFWISEEIQPSAWQPESLLERFMDCFRRLIYCVEYTMCFHYFIPDNNFFEGRFHGKQRKDLLPTLRNLYDLGWTCVLQTQTVHTFRDTFYGSPSISPNATAMSFLTFCQITLFRFPKAVQMFRNAVFNLTVKSTRKTDVRISPVICWSKPCSVNLVS